jgi:hypothetical protein
VVKKILITGHSLGGQTAEVVAVDPGGKDEFGNPILPLNLGRFQAKDVSIITFESPGIPSSADDPSLSLRSWVFGYYNTQDRFYSSILGNVHIGNKRPWYEAEPQINFLKVHNDTYQTYAQALTKSKL